MPEKKDPKVVDTTTDQPIPQLPKTQKAVHLSYTDPDGKVFGDTFVIKRMTLGDLREIGILKAQLNGGLNPDSLEPGVLYMNGVLAHLRVAVVKYPSWWKPDSFFDGDVVQRLYDEVLSFEESFRGAASKSAEGAAKDSAA